MKKILLILSVILLLVAVIIVSVNVVNLSAFWLFGLKNGSLSQPFILLLVLGLFIGFFLGIALTYKKQTTGEEDF